jgi:hypothetical protein
MDYLLRLSISRYDSLATRFLSETVFVLLFRFIICISVFVFYTGVLTLFEVSSPKVLHGYQRHGVGFFAFLGSNPNFRNFNPA